MIYKKTTLYPVIFYSFPDDKAVSYQNIAFLLK
jgi:hypothetical protein